jgi:hypothetical protein
MSSLQRHLEDAENTGRRLGVEHAEERGHRARHACTHHLVWQRDDAHNFDTGMALR